MWYAVFISISGCFLSFSFRPPPTPHPGVHNAQRWSQPASRVGVLGTTSQSAPAGLHKACSTGRSRGITESWLDMQNFGPALDLPNQNLHFQKTPGASSTLKHEKYCF